MAFNKGGSGFNRGGSGGFRRGGFRRSFDGPREMHKITCSKCGNEGEVPFKPREGSEVLCKECFMKSKGITPRDNKASAEKSEGSEEASEDDAEEETEDEDTEEDSGEE